LPQPRDAAPASAQSRPDPASRHRRISYRAPPRLLLHDRRGELRRAHPGSPRRLAGARPARADRRGVTSAVSRAPPEPL